MNSGSVVKISKAMITPELLRRLLRYDAATGRLYWRERAADLFAHCQRPANQCAAWNAQFAGAEAFTAVGSHGYLSGAVFNHTGFLAHRVIWALVHGAWPIEVDHINGDRCDNRLINLRSVSRSTNTKNKRLSSLNRSGAQGVYWAPHAKKWRAEIKADGRRTHLGYFVDMHAAIAARAKAEQEQGFHANHGRRA